MARGRLHDPCHLAPKKNIFFSVFRLDLCLFFCSNLLKMNDMKNTNWTEIKRLRAKDAEFNAEMNRIERQTFILETITAFCIGASIALGLVLLHGKFFSI